MSISYNCDQEERQMKPALLWENLIWATFPLRACLVCAEWKAVWAP